VVCVVGDASVEFKNCLFTNNTAGSTLHVSGSAATRVRLSNTTIQGSRGRYGAAVRVDGAAAVELLGSTLADNQGKVGGAVLATGAARLLVVNSILVNNSVADMQQAPAARAAEAAAGDPQRQQCRGGAIAANVTASVNITSLSRVLGNKAVCQWGRGGAISVGGSAVLTVTGESVLSGNSVRSTRVPMFVGVVRRAPTTSAFRDGTTPVNSIPAENVAAAGGAIWADSNAKVQLASAVVAGNTVNSIAGSAGGGAVAAVGSSILEVQGRCSIANNTANGTAVYGGGIWMQGSSSLRVTGDSLLQVSEVLTGEEGCCWCLSVWVGK
jgi:hypothetical protein